MCILESEKDQVKDEAKDQQMSPPPTPAKWIVAKQKNSTHFLSFSAKAFVQDAYPVRLFDKHQNSHGLENNVFGTYTFECF